MSLQVYPAAPAPYHCRHRFKVGRPTEAWWHESRSACDGRCGRSRPRPRPAHRRALSPQRVRAARVARVVEARGVCLAFLAAEPRRIADVARAVLTPLDRPTDTASVTTS